METAQQVTSMSSRGGSRPGPPLPADPPLPPEPKEVVGTSGMDWISGDAMGSSGTVLKDGPK